MAKLSPTIRDVAQKAGVSVSTVSRILTGTETAISISEETRTKVLEAAKELSYRPHPGARLLRGKGANLLGLILREIDDLFFAQVVQVISQAAQEKGWEIVLGYARNDPHEALGSLSLCSTCAIATVCFCLEICMKAQKIVLFLFK
jgi:LacI family transcriptional regulator